MGSRGHIVGVLADIAARSCDDNRLRFSGQGQASNDARRHCQPAQRIQILLDFGEVVNAVAIGIGVIWRGADGKLNVVGQAIAIAVRIVAGPKARQVEICSLPRRGAATNAVPD